MLNVRMLPLGPLQTNCFLAGCEETNEAAVIDPSWDAQEILSALDALQWKITHILLTHSHFDHVGALAGLKAATDVPVYAHAEAVPMLQVASDSAARWGLELVQPPAPDAFLEEGQVLAVGKLNFEVLYTPGHAPGHVSFHVRAHQVLFDGDVLFQGSIGRTDLPGGDYQTLISVIRQKLLVLPDETRVYCGHGNPTTIGDERRTNPFLQDQDGSHYA